ncbi:amidase family protein [Microbacterium lacus]|uniref:amidase family protein n=1 Tax=Microbacterium lacus TaxID=415217 RepID=UPI000C2CA363|nr:amidase family protein [Microbacterium lacus]
MTERLHLGGLDATAMIELMNRGDVSAAAVIDEHLALASGRGAELCAIVAQDPEAARSVARAVDEARRKGEPHGTLAGVPMTVKDSFDVRGLRTTHGRLSDSHVATEDAPAVARARAAGAVIYGKTNVPVLLDDYQSSNPDFGRTLNPWDPERTPGGSSGGSAAAIAAGLSALELGSDLSGSIRMPAAWCGIFGHRPSNGVLSKMGHLPWAVDGLIEPPVSVAGPMARSARDLSLAFEVLAGPARLDAVGWRLQLPPSRVDRLRGTRVGLWVYEPAAPIDDEMRMALLDLADTLRAAGCTVDELTKPPGAGAAGLELFDRLQGAEIAHSLTDDDWNTLVAAAADTDAPDNKAARALTQSARTAWQDAEAQRAITAAWGSVFDRFDVVLAPAVPGAAPRHDERPGAERRLNVGGTENPAADVVSAWSRMVNLAMLPSTVIPLGPGADTGMPLGAQLIGPYLEDRTPLRFAALMEAEGIIGFTPPNGW